MTPQHPGISRTTVFAGHLASLMACSLFCLVAPGFGQDAPGEKSSPAAIRQYRVAVALQNKAIYDLATEEWKTFIKDHRDDPLIAAADHYLGVCLFQQQKYAAAESAFEQSIERHVSADLMPATLLGLGLSQFNLGREQPAALKRSVASLTRLIKDYGSTSEAEEGSFYLAEALAGTGQSSEAIDRYRKTLAQYPRHAGRDRLLYGLAVALQGKGAGDQAIQVLRKLLRESPDSTLAFESSLRLGELLSASGQAAAAISLLTPAAAQQDQPLADYATLRLADALLQQKDYAHSADTYALLIDRYPKSSHRAAALVGAGGASYLAGNHSQARKWLQMLQREATEMPLSAVHWLARVEIADDQAAAALELLDPAMDRAVRSPLERQLQLDRADALYELPPRRREAFAAYAQLANSSEDDDLQPQATYMAAFTALDLKKYAEAQTFARAFQRKFPQHALTAEVLAIQAEAELQTEQPERAAVIWRKLLKTHPDHPQRDTWINRYAICLNRADQHEQVVSWLTPRWQQLRTDAAQAEALFLLGGAQLQMGDKKQGARLLRHSLQLDPEGPQSQRALLLLSDPQIVDRATALEAIEQLASRGSEPLDRATAWFRKAELLSADKDMPAAAGLYRQAIQSAPQAPFVPRALLGLAWCQTERAETTEAISTLERLHQEYPDDAATKESRYLLALVYHRAGQHQAAIRSLDAWLATDPPAQQAADAFYLRGLAQVAIEQYHAAAESFQQVLVREPDYASAEQVLYELAWARQQAGDTREANRAFSRLARDFPDGSLAAEAQLRIGEMHYADKRYEPARAAYLLAASNSKADPVVAELALHKAAWTSYQRQQYREAEQTFADQLRRFPNGQHQWVARLMQGQCAFEQEAYERALHLLVPALTNADLSRVNKDLAALSFLRAGQAAAQLQDWKQALRWLEQGQADYPASDHSLVSQCEQAWALHQLGQSPAAAELFAQVTAATDEPVGARAGFLLGELQFADKDYEQAIRTFFRVAYGYGYPQSPAAYHAWQANALFEAARCCESLQRYDTAKKLYQELVTAFPNSDKLRAARQKLSSLRGASTP